jgi:hypothetical protein
VIALLAGIEVKEIVVRHFPNPDVHLTGRVFFTSSRSENVAIWRRLDTDIQSIGQRFDVPMFNIPNDLIAFAESYHQSPDDHRSDDVISIQPVRPGRRPG